MSATDRDRLSTPSPTSPRQNPTPKTPKRICLPSQEESLHGSDDEVSWSSISSLQIEGMNAETSKQLLRSAVKQIKLLEQANLLLKGQNSHLRFNFRMLNSEREQMMKRLEVENDLSASNQSILLHKLNTTKDDEQLTRQRHLKAKRRVNELTEDTRRQQLSIDHLKRALSTTRPEYSTPVNRQDTSGHGEGGLEVLSDAAGLAQIRDMNESGSSLESAPASQQAQLLSPDTFPDSTGSQALEGSDLGPKKRRHFSHGDNQLQSNDADSLNAIAQMQNMSRRLTFNSSGPTVAPMTPKSPRRRSKLEPSAMA